MCPAIVDRASAGGLAAVLVALGACVAADVGDDPRLQADEWAEGCGGVLDDLARYAALPLVIAPPAVFTMAVLDIGQGDSTVIRTPSGCAALFDGGPTGTGPVIKANLAALGITHLDVAVVSHYHADHLGALDAVELGADGVPIAVAYDRGGAYTTGAYDQYAAQFADRRIAAEVGQVVDLCGEATLTVVAVGGNGTIVTDENGLSLAVKVSYGAFDALIGGDLTGVVPDIEALAAPAVGEVEAYKVHHHGSATSTNPALLAALRPTVSFISLGANNIFGHPAPTTMARLAAVSSAVWLTENPALATKDGPIVLTSATGDVYTVAQGGSTATYRSKGVVDTGPPTTPTDLAVTAAPTAVTLTWTAATDDLGVADYVVYRDGAIVATVPAPGLIDRGLAPDRAYAYAVAARDEDGGLSAPSPVVLATTPCAAGPIAQQWTPCLPGDAGCRRSPSPCR